MRYLLAVTMVCVLCGAGAAARAGYDVRVDLENVSGQDKTDWPVVLTVYHVFGRNLPPGSVNPKGYRVFDPSGKEVPCHVESIPPDDQQGNNDLVFVVPKMAAGEKLTYRITNTAEAVVGGHDTDPPDKPMPTGGETRDREGSVDALYRVPRQPIDVVGNPNNLLANGGFEKSADGGGAEGYTGQAALDMKVKRSGQSSLLLAGPSRRSAKYAATIPLHKGSWYYAGVWSKTENVARHGVHAGDGAHFVITGFEGITIEPKCTTRDWLKSRFFARYGIGQDEWGMDLGHAQATEDACTLELVLDQKKQFCMDSPEGKWWVDDAVLMEQPKVRVRHDLAVEPAMKDGVFFFTRPLGSPVFQGITSRPHFCSLPYAHEAVTTLDRCAVRGQRARFLLGLYHTRPIEQVKVELAGGTVACGEAKLALEALEYSPGFLDPKGNPQLMDHAAAVDLPGPRGVRYFLATFRVPADAAPGRYTGKLVVSFAGKAAREVPIVLRVQDLSQPVVRDVAIGSIVMTPRYGPETLKLYSRADFTSITIFGGFFKYTTTADGQPSVDLDHLGKEMDTLAAHGITAGVCPFSEFDLGPLWGGGALYKRVKGDKAAWQRELKRVDDFVSKKPEWPRMVYMTWDEPVEGEGWVKGKHGGLDERMGWVNEVCPDALSTADVMFPLLPKVFKYYTMPNFDDPCDYAGPEVYAFFRKHNKPFGLAANAWGGERSRYNYGMLPAASGAKYIHSYHAGYAMLQNGADGKPAGTLWLAAAGEGINDFKAWRLLTESIANSPAREQAVAAAKAYLEGIFKVWNGDHAQQSGPGPYLGRAYTWGYERFFDDWQMAMLRHAAAVKGVKWIE